MKRHLIYFLAAFLALVSSGCTLEDDGLNDDIELTIRLSMASKMNTRAPRPLEGVDHWQHVTAVRVYLFRSDEENGEYTLYQPQYSGDETETNILNYIDVKAFYKEDIYTDPKYEQHTVVVKPKLPEGYYRLLAIGVDEDESLFAAINEKSTWNNILKTVEDTPVTEEFFSGYSETVHVTPSIEKNFISIELKRCVAGVLLYVKNIPPTKEVANIKLLLSGYSQTTDIVNRTWKTEAIESEIVLAEFNADSVNENFKITNEDQTESTEPRFHTGRFLLPSHTGKLTAKPTMKMVYYNAKGEELKSKKVVMIGEFEDDKEVDYDYDYENPDLELDKKRTHYNLLANHIYCIGYRSVTGKKYEPIDLSDDSDEVRIIAYGSWQADVDIIL